MASDSSHGSGIIGFVLFLVALFAFVSLKDCSRRESWKDSYKDIAARVGLETSDLIAPYGGTLNTYRFRDKENDSVGDPLNKDDDYPPTRVLYCDRSRNLELSWDFSKHVFWNSEPAVHVESPSFDTATIQDKSEPPPSTLQMGYVSHPKIAIRIESGNPEPHIVQLRLQNMHVAIAEMKGTGFEYRTQSIAPTTLRVLLSSATPAESQKSEPQEASTPSPLAPEAYNDPKGFFRIVPPKGWRLREYPQDPRGKVAFIAPGDQIDLRLLSKAVDISDYDGLLKNLKDIEAQLGVPMNIEPVVFNGMPAIKRVATVTMQGVTQKLLWIDLLIDGLSHNLQYGAPPNVFDEHYDTAWESMLTYEPLKREKPSSPEEARKHEAAKWIRLAMIALEMGKTQAAKDAVSAGLEADPENGELKELKSDLEKR